MKCLLLAACLPAICLPLIAQTATSAPASKNVSCKADKTPLTPAEIEFEQGEHKTAADHFITELAAHPNDDRLRAWQIRNLLEDGQIQPAEEKASAWVAEAPSSGPAQTAKAEVMMRQGAVAQAYALAAQAQKLDPCNGRAYFVLAKYEQMTALYATEKKHLDLGHVLAPNDDEITFRLISLEPREKAILDMQKLLETSSGLTEKERTRLKERLPKEGAAPTAPQCRMTSITKNATIPFSAIRYSPDSPPAYGLEMSFNGKKRRLELDTGASGLLLTTSAAEHLGLKIEGSVGLGGIGDEGTRHGQVAHVASLTIGDLQFENCVVNILPPRDMEFAGMGLPPFMDDIDGLVGGDLFRNFLLTLDYPGGELRLAPLPARPNDTTEETSLDTLGNHSTTSTNSTLHDHYRAPEMSDWLQFYRIHHYILVPTQLNDGPVKLMMADTGAELNSIDPEAARTVARVSTTENFSMQGISGKTNRSYIADKIVLHFGKLYMPLQSMVAFPTTSLSKGAGVEISGFLGFQTLRQMTVKLDYRDNLVSFEFDPKRPVNAKFRGNAFTGY